MPTTTAEPEATTIPHDPEAQAIENQLADTLVAELDIGEQALDVLVQLNINSVGKFLDKTNNGENPELMIKAGLPRDAADDILIAIADKRDELIKAAESKSASKEAKLPEPSKGAHGYEVTTSISIGSVTTAADGKHINTSCKIPLSGSDGHVGLEVLRAIKTFRGAELDLELRQAGGQQSLEGLGLKDFHGVAHIGNVSLTGDEKHISFTMKFVRKAINGNALAAYAGKDAELRCTNNAGAEDATEHEPDPNQLALDDA